MRKIFTKMHSLGNDFMIVNAITTPFAMSTSEITMLAHRNVGVGFDQLLVIEKSTNADFFCRIYNADGSQAEQCGNGLRCVASYLYEQEFIITKTFKIETLAGIFQAEILNNGLVSIELGSAKIISALTTLTFPQSDLAISASIVSMGNPHAIIRVEDATIMPDLILAKQISAHEIFPEGVNIGFVNVIDENHIKLQTFERGAGKTFACGSNACAALAAGMTNSWLASPLQVDFELGSVEVRCVNEKIILTGPVTTVYEGFLI